MKNPPYDIISLYLQYIQDIISLIYKYNLEIERFLTKNLSGRAGFTPPNFGSQRQNLGLRGEYLGL